MSFMCGACGKTYKKSYDLMEHFRDDHLIIVSEEYVEDGNTEQKRLND